jgi:hypothetical protein
MRTAVARRDGCSTLARTALHGDETIHRHHFVVDQQQIQPTCPFVGLLQKIAAVRRSENVTGAKGQDHGPNPFFAMRYCHRRYR